MLNIMMNGYYHGSYDVMVGAMDSMRDHDVDSASQELINLQ